MEAPAEILIVDDLPTNLDVVSTILAPLGYSITTVTSGEQALKQLKRYQPDLILLDIQMPVMDGFEVCERIKANLETAHIPIIFLTVQSDAHSITRAFDLGAVDYISKPFQEKELVARVKTHLKLQCVNQFLEKQVAERTHQLAVKTEELQIALAESKAAQQQLDSLIVGTAATTGSAFFPALARHISKVLNVSGILITQRLNRQLKTLAFWVNDALQPELIYNCAQTPCEQMIQKGEFYCPSGVQTEFPEHELLGDLGLDSYLGIALKTSDGKTIGGLSILHQASIPNPERAQQLLTVFAARAAAELECQQSNQALESLNQSLEAQVVERTNELRNNEERLRLAMRAANQGFFDINLQTDEAIVSPEYALMLGYDPANFHETAVTWRSRLHPEDSESTHQAYRAYVAGQVPRYSAEFRQQTQKGAWKWILSMGQFIEWDEAGNPTRFLGIHTDIDDRKSAEVQLKIQNTLLEKVAQGDHLDDILHTLIVSVEHSLNGALGSILFLDSANCLRQGIGPNLPSEYTQAIDGIAIGEGVGSCGTAAFRKEPVIVDDMTTNALWCPYKDLALNHDLRACWSTPIFASDGAVLGTFAMYYRVVKSPNAYELNLIARMAHIAGIAIERQRADEKLRRSEAKLLEAQRVAHLGNWELNVATQATTWSPEMFRICGLEPAETAPAYQDYLEMLQADDRQRLEQHLKRAISQGTPYTFECSTVHPDGILRHHECRAETERDDQGHVTRLFGTALDITARKQAEQALQNLIAGTATNIGEDFFPALVSYMARALEVSHAIVSELVEGNLRTLAFWADGVMQTNLTYHPSKTPCEVTLQEGNYYCAHSVQRQFPEDPDLVDMGAESYLGIALQNAQGKAIGDLCILNHQAIPNPQQAEQIMRVFAARAAAELERQQAQTKLKDLNAALETKVAERTAELETSRAYYQGIISDQTELICRFLPDSTLTFVNEAFCEFFQKSSDELIGQHYVSMLPGADQAICIENFRSLSINNPVSTCEHHVIAPDGSLHWQQWSERALFSPDGTFIEYQAVGRDITDRKRAEQALENLIAGTAGITGQDFFPALVCHISQALEITYVCVAAKISDHEMEILAFWGDGALQSAYSYDPRTMPCQTILEQGTLYCEHSVQQRFPQDALLIELKAQCYLGVAIYSAQGEAIGNLCIFDTGRIADPQRAEQILRVFAARAGAELERQWATTALEQLNQSLELKVAERTAELQEREISLRASEQRYISLAAAAPVGIFRHNASGNCIYVNQQACDITGLSREVLMGDHWQTALHPEDRNRTVETWIQCFQTQTPYQLEYRFQQPDGTVRWVYTQALPEWDESGNMIGYIGTITDISDRKIAEIALQNLIAGTAATTGQDFFPALVQHLATALDISAAFVAESVGDEIQGLAFWMNGAFQPSFSCPLHNTPCELILRHGRYYCESALQQQFPNNQFLKEWQADSYLGLALQSTQGEMLGTLCIFNHHPITNPKQAEKLMQVFAARAVAELERQQTQIALEELNRSLEEKITERTAALQASRAYYQSIVADQTELICRFLPDGTLTFVNDAYCQYFQKASEDLIGSSFLNLLPPAERQGAMQALKNLSPQAPVSSYEHQVLAPNKTLCWQQWTDRAFFDDQGNAIEFQSVGRDITPLKETTAQLETSNIRLTDSNKELESFAYSVSHDLRAPLRAIDGFSKALLEDYGDTFDEMASNYFTRIRKNIARMSMLIDDLLSLSRVSQAELRLTSVNLSQLAQEIVGDLQDSNPDRAVDIIIASDITVVADLMLMRVMLANLLQNAWKFTSHHPTARIEFGIHHHPEQPPTYWVKDDGAGFNMAYVDKLFGVFQRLHTEHEFPGTGIGLATVQRIIHRHRGRVWADAAVEQGATFYFTVPQPH